MGSYLSLQGLAHSPVVGPFLREKLTMLPGMQDPRVNSCIKMDCAKVVDTLDMEDLGDKGSYPTKKTMLEIQEVPILRWIPCEAQQSHWRQCGAFDHQEGSLIDIKLFCIVVCLASIMDVHFPNIIKTVDLMAVNWVSLI